VDDFDVEVELLKNHPDFMAFLRQLSQEIDSWVARTGATSD
jgi:hypothetical protein